jgi:hypothetical protein
MYDGATLRDLALRYCYLVGYLGSSADAERLIERLAESAVWSSDERAIIAQDILAARSRAERSRGTP